MTATLPDRPHTPARHDPRPTARRWLLRGRGLAAVLLASGAAASTHAQPLLVVVLVAVLAAVLIAARPEGAALVAIGLLYTNAVVVVVNHHGVPGAAAGVVPLLFLVTISYRVFALRLPLVLPRPGVWVIAFAVAQLLGAVTARDPEKSVTVFQTFLLEGLLLFLLVTNAVRGADMVRAAVVILVVTAAALGALGAVQKVTGGDLGGFATSSRAVVGADAEGGGGARRQAGPIGEQNRWAQSLAVVVPLALALAITDRSRVVRLAATISLAGIATGIVLTYSRGAVVGLALTGLIAVLARWVRVKVAVAVVLVVGLGLATFAPVFAGRARTVVDAGSSVRRDPSQPVDGSMANRTTEAVAALSVFLHHPVAGVGVGLFPTYFQDEARRQGADRIVGVNREAHDLYLGIAAETGVAGLVAFAGLIGSLLGPLARVRRRHLADHPDVAGLATGFSLAVVTYLTTGIFLHFAYIRYFWLLVALAAAMSMVDVTGGRTGRTVTATGHHAHQPRGTAS